MRQAPFSRFQTWRVLLFVVIVSCPVTDSAGAPDNDDLGSCTALSGAGGTVTGTTDLATLQGTEASLLLPLTVTNTVWYCFTPAIAGRLLLFTDIAETEIHAYSGAAGATETETLTLVAAEPTCDVAFSCFFLDVLAIQYYIRVGLLSGTPGAFELSWTLGTESRRFNFIDGFTFSCPVSAVVCIVPVCVRMHPAARPSNDDIASATTITGSTGDVTQTLAGATTELFEVEQDFCSQRFSCC
jgi:hypothetical protein